MEETMTEENKKLKVQFEPGCFDSFEGTQEELEALQKEIMEIFSSMTPEELEAQSRPVDIEELMEEDPEIAEVLLQQLDQSSKRNLQ